MSLFNKLSFYHCIFRMFYRLTVKLETSKSEMNEFLSRISELQQTLLSEEQRYKALEAVNNNLCLQLEEMKLAKDQLVANEVIDQRLNSHSLDVCLYIYIYNADHYSSLSILFTYITSLNHFCLCIYFVFMNSIIVSRFLL